MSSSSESEQMKSALTGLFSAYKERVEAETPETRYPLYTVAFDYPEYKTGQTYLLFGSFAEISQLGKPKILTVISGGAQARIVAAANWIKDWPDVFDWEGRVYVPNWNKFNSATDGMIDLVNKMSLKIRFNIQDRSQIS